MWSSLGVLVKQRVFSYVVSLAVSYLLSQGEDIAENIESYKLKAINYIKENTDGIIENLAVLMFDEIWNVIVDVIIQELEKAGISKLPIEAQAGSKLRSRCTFEICNQLDRMAHEHGHHSESLA